MRHYAFFSLCQSHSFSISISSLSVSSLFFISIFLSTLSICCWLLQSSWTQKAYFIINDHSCQTFYSPLFVCNSLPPFIFQRFALIFFAISFLGSCSLSQFIFQHFDPIFLTISFLSSSSLSQFILQNSDSIFFTISFFLSLFSSTHVTASSWVLTSEVLPLVLPYSYHICTIPKSSQITCIYPVSNNISNQHC